jgi:general secretion pathway protein K
MTVIRHFFQQVRRHDGFIVVAVLWILVALATLATVYALYVRNTAAALLVHDERVQSEALVTAALELVAYRMTATAKDAPAHGAFTFRVGRTNVAVEFRPENARIDLNAAPRDFLAGLFTVLGTRAEIAQSYAERVVAWRTRANGAAADDEITAYKAAGLSYQPRLAPFPHPGELSLVLGLPSALVDRAMPFVTVYSGQPQISIFDARPEVIAALPGMSPDRLNDVLALRQGAQQNNNDILAAIGPGGSLVTITGSRSTRVTVRVVFENGRRTASEVVMLVSEGAAEPYSVLSWRDETDEMAQ